MYSADSLGEIESTARRLARSTARETRQARQDLFDAEAPAFLVPLALLGFVLAVCGLIVRSLD
jgi:hypothetical protein